MKGNAPVYQVNPAILSAGEGRGEEFTTWGTGCDQEGAGGGGESTLGRIDVGVCITYGAKSRPCCGWWGWSGRWGGAGRELKQRH